MFFSSSVKNIMRTTARHNKWLIKYLIFILVATFIGTTNPALAEMPVVVEEVKTEKQIIEEYFKDIPIMIDVQRCESIKGQFNEDGTVVKGKVDSRDTGALQINIHYHLANSKKLGLDIYTLEGNLAYGRYLYSQNGTRDWNASKGCWNPNREVIL